MKTRMKALSLVDLHVYGGALLVAAGLASWYAPAGAVALGLSLMFLGLRSPPRSRS